MFDALEVDVRAMGAAASSIGIERHPNRAAMWSGRAEIRRVLARWGEDEYRGLLEGGGYQRQVELDDRGMFPGTLAP